MDAWPKIEDDVGNRLDDDVIIDDVGSGDVASGWKDMADEAPTIALEAERIPLLPLFHFKIQ